jgi:hypothetical protein
VNWNGHYIVGYIVAISITALIARGLVAFYTGTEWVSWAAHTPTPDPISSAPSSTPSSLAAPCYGLREARDPDAITTSIMSIAADKAANDTAGEYAGYYLGRDAANASVQNKEIPIIQFYCAL